MTRHLADTLGMSLVHTNKTLKRLFVSKAIRWKDRIFEMVDRAALAGIAGRDVTSRNPGERRAIDHFEYAVLPANCLADEQPLQRLVGVNQRHAERVGKMLLREGKLNDPIFHQGQFLGAHEQMQ